MPLIDVQDVYKTYHVGEVDVAALDGASLTVEQGEFTVLAGRSGSGKSTLLNMIGALDLPDRGTIQIDGEDFLAVSKDARAEFRLQHIGFVFQAYNLIRVLSARENVAYVLQLQGVVKHKRLQRAQQWLEEVGLGDMGDRRPDQLSGGQQQRVAVARALCSKPKIILADEPTANLDSQTGEALIQLMFRLNEEYRCTFLIASHDPLVLAHAKRVVEMTDGRVGSE